jgi:hypothetical protein
VVIPQTVTALGSSVFYGCSSLASITAPFPNKYYSGATFSYYFGNSQIPSLKTVTLSEAYGNSLPYNAFYNFTGIEELNLPDGLLTIGQYAFKNCSALTSLVIPDTVTNMGTGMLLGTSALTSITLPYASTSENSTEGFTYFYYDYGYYYPSFQSPAKLSTVTLTKATQIPSQSFQNFTSIHHINLPSTLRTIASSAFSGCSSLNAIVLPANLTSISSTAFDGCTKLYEITNLSNQSISTPQNCLRIFNSETERAD